MKNEKTYIGGRVDKVLSKGGGQETDDELGDIVRSDDATEEVIGEADGSE